jgi:sphinganine-1-phosphate aldolase
MVRDQIRATLTDMKSRDLATEGGAAFAYVYDSGEREAAALATQAYAMFLGANGLDPRGALGGGRGGTATRPGA